jgi:hypothetical protein
VGLRVTKGEIFGSDRVVTVTVTVEPKGGVTVENKSGLFHGPWGTTSLINKVGHGRSVMIH